MLQKTISTVNSFRETPIVRTFDLAGEVTEIGYLRLSRWS